MNTYLPQIELGFFSGNYCFIWAFIAFKTSILVIKSRITFFWKVADSIKEDIE